MTNEQKNQVAAMNASGMSVDEITIDTGLDKQTVADFVAERNAKKKGRGHPISEQTKQAIIEWYQSGHPVSQTAKKFGVDPKTAKNALGLLPKEKEPTAAATATDSDVKDLQIQDSTKTAESQALRGVEMIGVMQSMLLAAEGDFGAEVDIMALKADSDTASIMFRYGGTAYSVQFGLAF
jgi:transposase-like protein